MLEHRGRHGCYFVPTERERVPEVTECSDRSHRSFTVCAIVRAALILRIFNATGFRLRAEPI